MFVSCSTEKNTWLNRGYHNMTARFNGYHNATVLTDEAIDAWAEGHTEDFYKILDPLLLPDPTEATGLFPALDTAITKCERVILRHSMPNPQVVTNKDDEHCRWIDENWLRIGQNHYIKHELEDAEKKLRYVVDAYSGEESVYEARLWLARTYIRMGRLPDAKKELKAAQKAMDRTQESKDGDNGSGKKRKKSKYARQKEKQRKKEAKENAPADFPKRLNNDYHVVMAEYYIASEEYKKGAESLEEAVLVTRNRKEKARYMYVLAQLYHLSGNGDQASYYYNKVAHSSAPYDMQFQAKINKALSATSGGPALRKELNKMLKEDKNVEFKDQIYFALAEIDMKEGNVKSAKTNYTNSAFWSVKNNRQKGESYLKLGDLSFGEKDYLSAQKYYDSCIQVLPEEYPDYEKIKAKAAGLSDLVFHYETYVFEDSVQRIAIMPEKEREKFLEQTLKQILEEQKRKKAEEAAKLLALQKKLQAQTASNSGGGGGGSKFYFYNNKRKGTGFNDFRSQWGQRELEDHWRRADKQSLGGFAEDDENADSLGLDADSLTVDMLRQDLPLSPESMDTSVSKLMNSLYMLGVIYKEQLKEIPEATTYFKKVVNRGEEHEKVLPAHYQLYLIYKLKGSSSEAEGQKSIILKEFPDSEIASILIDPDYLKKKLEKDQEELKEYSATYEKYRYWKYAEVDTKCTDVIANDTTNQFLNKYYLLKAFALSHLRPGNQAVIAEPLVALVQLDPDSEEGKQAKIYLKLLQNGGNITGGGNGDESTATNGSAYVVDPDSKHFFIVVLPVNSGAGASASKMKLSNFNNEYFRNKNLNVVPSLLGDSEILRVNSFEDMDDGNTYRTTFESTAAKSALGAMSTDNTCFLINKHNFKELMGSRNIDEYLDFYKKNYL